MATRRMISKTVAHTQKFLQLPLEAQGLYFHLVLGADDDGIVEAFPIFRMTGASEDSLRLLEAKGYISAINDEMVYFLTDFHEQNYIRADRKIDSKYKVRLLEVFPEVELVERKQRTDRTPKEFNHGADMGRTWDSPNKQLESQKASKIKGYEVGQPEDNHTTDMGRTWDSPNKQLESQKASKIKGYEVGQPEDNHTTDMGRFSIVEYSLGKDSISQLKSVEENNNQTATADPTEKEIQDISNYYQSRIGVLDGYHHTQLIEFLTIDKMEPELLKRAIDKSADNSKRNFSYVKAILRNWVQNGIKTIAQQDEEERNYTASKNKGKVATESNSIFPDDIDF